MYPMHTNVGHGGTDDNILTYLWHAKTSNSRALKDVTSIYWFMNNLVLTKLFIEIKQYSISTLQMYRNTLIAHFANIFSCRTNYYILISKAYDLSIKSRW